MSSAWRVPASQAEVLAAEGRETETPPPNHEMRWNSLSAEGTSHPSTSTLPITGKLQKLMKVSELSRDFRGAFESTRCLRIGLPESRSRPRLTVESRISRLSVKAETQKWS